MIESHTAFQSRIKYINSLHLKSQNRSRTNSSNTELKDLESRKTAKTNPNSFKLFNSKSAVHNAASSQKNAQTGFSGTYGNMNQVRSTWSHLVWYCFKKVNCHSSTQTAMPTREAEASILPANNRPISNLPPSTKINEKNISNATPTKINNNHNHISHQLNNDPALEQPFFVFLMMCIKTVLTKLLQFNFSWIFSSFRHLITIYYSIASILNMESKATTHINNSQNYTIHQFAYRLSHSTGTALFHVFDDVYQGCVNKNILILIYFRFSTASNTWSQNIVRPFQLWIFHLRLGAQVVSHIWQKKSTSLNLALITLLRFTLNMVFHKDLSLQLLSTTFISPIGIIINKLQMILKYFKNWIFNITDCIKLAQWKNNIIHLIKK